MHRAVYPSYIEHQRLEKHRLHAHASAEAVSREHTLPMRVEGTKRLPLQRSHECEANFNLLTDPIRTGRAKSESHDRRRDRTRLRSAQTRFTFKGLAIAAQPRGHCFHLLVHCAELTQPDEVRPRFAEQSAHEQLHLRRTGLDSAGKQRGSGFCFFPLMTTAPATASALLAVSTQ